MATTNYKTNLSTSTATFDKMIQRFGVVTVMNAKVYDTLPESEMEGKTAYEIREALKATEALCSLDTLKIANVTIEGPSKTVTGGQYSNPLIKFGKTARLEMQDALGNANAIACLSGGIVESKVGASNPITALHNGEDFAGPKTIIGESFFIEQKSGAQVPVEIIFYQFLPDSLFNLTQDAEGDATVFDMNGDLLTTTISVGNEVGDGTIKHGVFYSIIDPKEVRQTE